LGIHFYDGVLCTILLINEKLIFPKKRYSNSTLPLFKV